MHKKNRNILAMSYIYDVLAINKQWPFIDAFYLMIIHAHI